MRWPGGGYDVRNESRKVRRQIGLTGQHAAVDEIPWCRASSPSQLTPDWEGAIAMWNPVSSTANAVRELFGNPVAGGDSWIENHA